MRIALALCLVAGMAGAVPPESSLRPLMRGQAAVEQAPPAVAEPAAEPAVEQAPEVARVTPPVRRIPGGGPDAAGRRQAGASTLRPAERPPQVVERAAVVRRERERGSVCGDISIQGESIGAVPGRVAGCGIEDAVRIRSVAGIGLTQRAVMDCGTAQALNAWVTNSAKPALSRINGGLDRLKIAAHYTCRSRNGLSGTRISEHGKGRAIDISGFHMRDGSLITVEQGWTAGPTTQAMRRLHRGACGSFGTVLGPDADSFHRDHFHFDTARYRNGTYCR